MTKSELLVKQICLPNIISNVTSNKNELGKTVRLTSFQKAQLQSVLILLQVCLSAPPFVFAVIYSFFQCFYWLFLCFTQFGDSFHCLNFDKFRDTAALKNSKLSAH